MTTTLRDDLQSALGDAYRIDRELGGGGMSRVFVAEETRFGRTVVIKVLSPDLGASLSAERFEREIRLAARLQHPHIVPLISAGDVGGLPYYTMPFVAGSSLRERMLGGPIPLHDTQNILRDVAKALAYAHRQGIVHRDIKPENILLNEGTAMVADFGVARALEAASTLSEGNGSLTQTGTQIGTPMYMAPEQAAGDPSVDFRADLYAFGVMAYELLAGQHPFSSRKTPHAMVIAHMTEAPAPISTHAATVSHSMASMVMACLGKDPSERPHSASDIVQALESGSGGPVVMPPIVSTPAPSSASIAVLPFANMSGDPDNEYFSDGITDDIIMALTQVKALRIAARTSSFTYKNKNEDLAAIGRALGVSSVLQGSVRRAGNRVRVTVQLMNAQEGVQLWSERFDRDLDDIFAIQDEIARGIVEQLQVTLGIKHSTTLVSRPTDDLEAYQLYLRGREAAATRSPASLRRAIDFFKQVLARDPNYALAHVGLAEAHIGLGVYQYIPTIDAAREAEESLQAAQRLAPNLAALHVLWGQLKLYLRADWHEAGPHLERALAIDPNEPLAYAYLAFLHGMLGNLEESKAFAAQAVARDPLSVLVRAVSVMGFPRHGIPGADSAAALEAHEAALAMDPNSVPHLWMASVRLQDLGRSDEALAYMSRAVELTQRGPLVLGMLGRLHALSGRVQEARAIRTELLDRSRREYIGPAARLMMIALDFDDEEAMAALLRENLEAMTPPTAISTVIGRELELLLDHPRLGHLVRQLTFWATAPRTSSHTLAGR